MTALRAGVHVTAHLSLTADDLDGMAAQRPCTDAARVWVYVCPWQPHTALYVVRVGETYTQETSGERRGVTPQREHRAQEIVKELRRSLSLAAWRPAPEDLEGDLKLCATRLMYAAWMADHLRRQHDETKALLEYGPLVLIEEVL